MKTLPYSRHIKPEHGRRRIPHFFQYQIWSKGGSKTKSKLSGKLISVMMEQSV